MKVIDRQCHRRLTVREREDYTHVIEWVALSSFSDIIKYIFF